MYTGVEFVPCNGQHITYQHADGWALITQVPEDIDNNRRMERKELTLSFHNLIKRGSVLLYLLCEIRKWFIVFLLDLNGGNCVVNCSVSENWNNKSITS